MKKRVLAAFMLAASAAPGWSEPMSGPVGPIVRSLGSDFYLVQCNSCRLQPDEPVLIVRNGQEVGAGRVMRSENGYCTVRLISGTASAADSINRPALAVKTSDRGPTIPVQYTQASRPCVTNAPVVRPANANPPQDYWRTLENGRVFNLNTGQVH